jgi:hypothetical protein
MAGHLFDHYTPLIAALPDRLLTAADLLTDEFLLAREDDLASYYIPFERVNPTARVVLIGITPGLTQMRIAYEVARDGLREELPHSEILERVDETASFAGSMRTNLDHMLDQLGLPALLGIRESGQLFGDESHLMHSTSALRNPVFLAGHNYTGSAPEITETPLLRNEVLTVLGPELVQVPDAIVIPLGKAAQRALQLLIREGLIAEQRCCMGFPHPSGANGHRVQQFEQRREPLAQALASWFGTPMPSSPPPPAPILNDDVWERAGRAISDALTLRERGELADRLRKLANDLSTQR